MGVNKEIARGNDTKTKMQKSHLRIDTKISSENHSKDIEVNDSTDLVSSVKCKSEYGCQIETRCSLIEYGLHKNEDEYGKGSIRQRVRFDEYGGARRAADLKFKCVRETEECTDAFGRTMGVHVRVVAVIGLVFMLLATSAAAPARSRTGRSTHIEKNAIILLNLEGSVINEIHESASPILSIAALPNQLFIVGRQDGNCTVISLQEAFSLVRVQLTGSDCDGIRDLAFNGKWIFAGCRDSYIRKYDFNQINVHFK